MLAGKGAQGESTVEKAAAPGFQIREKHPPEMCQLDLTAIIFLTKDPLGNLPSLLFPTDKPQASHKD